MSECLPKSGCEGCIYQGGNQLSDEKTVRLSEYGPGERGTIRAVCGEPDFRLRMMEMGLMKGTQVKVVKYAPLTDPIEFVVKGYHLSLRRDQAAEIIMEEPEKAA